MVRFRLGSRVGSPIHAGRLIAVLIAAALLMPARAVTAQPTSGQRGAAGPLPSIEERTGSMKKIDGFFPVYWDERSGQLFLEIARFNAEVLLSTGIASGLGSNDIGIDRGALAGSRIVVFERVGPKVLLVAAELPSSAPQSTNPVEVQDVRDAFARSVLWGFQAAAESAGRVLVDATEFLVRDATNIGAAAAPGRVSPRSRRAARSTCR